MQIIKKINLSDDLRSSAARYLAALICVIIVGMALIAAQGADVTKAFAAILKGAFGSKTGFGSTLRYVMPCMMLGIAAAVAFKTGVYNMV
jgi:simple sugar transport system permease protein